MIGITTPYGLNIAKLLSDHVPSEKFIVKKTTFSVIRPTYLDRFRCVGSECIEHCCRDWEIAIDKVSYKHYRKVIDPVLKPLLKANLERNQNQHNEAHYAQFQLNAITGICGMLEENGLCAIHARLGARGLPYICDTYPRFGVTVGELRQVAGAPSCTEIVRLAILDDNGIEFEQIQVMPGSMLARLHYPQRLQMQRTDRPDHYFDIINGCCMQLVRTGMLPLWIRLVAVGILLRQIDERVEQGECNSIPGLIETFIGWIESGDCRNELTALHVDYREIMLRIMFGISQARLHVYAGLGRQSTLKMLLCQAFEGLGMQFGDSDSHGSVTPEAAIIAFSYAYHDYYLPVLGAKEKYLENYVTNYIFLYQFPFNCHKRLFDGFQELVVQVGLLRFYLVGLAGYHRESFARDHALRLISTFCRAYEHDRPFVSSIRRELAAQGQATLGMMAVLAGLSAERA